jgi:hypothetical protein
VTKVSDNPGRHPGVHPQGTPTEDILKGNLEDTPGEHPKGHTEEYQESHPGGHRRVLWDVPRVVPGVSSRVSFRVSSDCLLWGCSPGCPPDREPSPIYYFSKTLFTSCNAHFISFIQIYKNHLFNSFVSNQQISDSSFTDQWLLTALWWLNLADLPELRSASLLRAAWDSASAATTVSAFYSIHSHVQNIIL